MATNGPTLNSAQKAIIQQAIDAHNKKCGSDQAKKIDQNDVFTIAKKDGVISVRIDAYGYDGTKIVADADGQYDLELSFKDTTFDSNKKDYKFKTMDDSSDNLQKLVKQAQDADSKINQKEVTFANDNDERFTNIQDINEKFSTLMDGDTVTVTAGDQAKGTKPNISLENLDKGLDNLEKLLEKIEDADITTETEFLSDEEKDVLAVATNSKKATKALRKEMLADIEKAIDDLKDMKKALEKEQKQAVKDKNSANKELQELGVDDKSRVALIRKEKGIAEAMADKSDYKQDDIKKGLDGKYAMDKPEAFAEDKVNFDASNLPAQFSSRVTQNMTRVAAESAIKKFNEENPTAQIDLNNVAQITVNEKTGDILIGMKDSVSPDDKADKTHDNHYDYKIPGFYNSKSGVLNTEGLKVENYGFASTKGVENLYEQLEAATKGMQHLTGDDRKDQDKVINGLVKKLTLAGEDPASVRQFMADVIRKNNIVDSNV